MGDSRFAAIYERIRDSENRVAQLRTLSDEEVIAALGGASSDAEPLVANFLATEAMNRVRRARRVLDALPDGVIATDRQGKVTAMNPAAERMLGWMREDVTGRHLSEIAFVPTKGGDPETNALLDPLRSSVGTEFEDAMLTTGDGREIHMDANAVPLIVDGATMGAVVTLSQHEGRLLDALHEKEALLREIHHRVKNNLQVTSALLLLQSKRAKDETTRQAFLESMGRVKSMALVHEKLYGSANLAAVDFGSYLTDLARELARVYGAGDRDLTVDASVADVQLDLDTASTTGLIVNELVSNSLKHAFKGRTSGRVHVMVEPFGDDMLALIVSDDGVGMPPDVDLTRARSMGLQVVAGLVQQLDGTIAVERNGGTRVRIEFSRTHDARERMKEASAWSTPRS